MRELLRVFEVCAVHRVRSKEGGDAVFGQMTVLDRLIVIAEVNKDSLVAFVEGISSHAAVVVDDGAPAAVLEDADKLGAGTLQVEPVHRLAHSDQVDGVVVEAGRLGGSIDTSQMRVLRGQSGARLAHLLIRFDGDDVEAVCEKDFGQQTRACSDVGDDRAITQSALSREKIRDRRWIAGAV